MRAFERFLVVLAFISLIMRVGGLKDAPTLELVGITALALFYLLVFPFLLFKMAEPGFKKSWLFWLPAFLSGAALGYCLISLMCYTLNWIKASDMLVNGSLICAALIAGAVWGRRMKQPFWRELIWRASILWLVILVVSALRLPEIGSIAPVGAGR